MRPNFSEDGEEHAPNIEAFPAPPAIALATSLRKPNATRSRASCPPTAYHRKTANTPTHTETKHTQSTFEVPQKPSSQSAGGVVVVPNPKEGSATPSNFPNVPTHIWNTSTFSNVMTVAKRIIICSKRSWRVA